MKQFSWLPVLLFCFVGRMYGQSPDSCGCLNCPNFMPDNFVGEFLYQVNGATHNDLADSTQGVCGVRVHFDHEYLGDLHMQLISPAGQSVALVGPVGYFGMTDFTDWNITFVPCDSVAAPDPGFTAHWNNNQIWGQGNFYTGSYYPNADCLEQFDSGSVVGIWRLVVADAQAVDVGNLYDFEVLFCDTTGTICPVPVVLPIAEFGAVPDGWEVLLTDYSMYATNYQLDYGDSTNFMASFFLHTHSYADTGTYVIRLIVSNQFGADTAYQTVHISGSLPEVGGITADVAVGCAPLQTRFYALNADHVDTYHWLLPGALPAESFDPDPLVTYDSAGLYPVSLIITNTVGADTLFIPAFVTVEPALTNPGFTLQVQGDSIIATNTTQGFTDFYWLLELNNVPIDTGFAQPQVFVVDTSGLYQVTLVVSNDCGQTSIQHSAPVILSEVKDGKADSFGLTLLPNPNTGHFRLEVRSAESLFAGLTVLNAAGQPVFSQKTALLSGKNNLDVDLPNLPSGVYWLRLQTEAGSKSIPFRLEH